jgi:acyl-coenzyme A synthetase/AMP-(fatty) acid ligase
MREEIVFAFVVPESGMTGDDALREDIQSFAKENMAGYKYPCEIAFVNVLPRDDVGKVQYDDLEDRL